VNAEAPAGGREPGLRGALARLGESSFALLRTRVELAAVEFSESRDRARDHLVLAAIAGVAFAFAWAGLCALVVVTFWESNRIGALAGIVVFHVVAAALALWRLRANHAGGPAPFTQTLAELERDRQWLSEHFRSER
jgi:uncharacterized membrane protein YqjE